MNVVFFIRLDSSTNPSESRPEHKASDAEVVASKTRATMRDDDTVFIHSTLELKSP